MNKNLLRIYFDIGIDSIFFFQVPQKLENI